MKDTAAKGRRLVQLAKKILEARGCRVEVASNQIRWIFKPGFEKRAISVHHDLFGIWDLLAVWPNGTRAFYQVTVVAEVSRRREKILAANFPWTTGDAILGYQGGRGCHFKFYPAPMFEKTDERWNLVR